MPAKRKTKQQLEQERFERAKFLAARESVRQQREREKTEKLRQKKAEAKHREWLRKERSKPRTEIPAQYGESIHVHKRVLDSFMKQMGRKINIESSRVVGGAGGWYEIKYTIRGGGSGVLELRDLGPMPT